MDLVGRSPDQEWPFGFLDVAGLAGEGRDPVPFRQFVLKVHSRCNLTCDYCYVYHHADQSWRNRPPVMSEATVAATARRIAEHAANFDLDRVTVVLHGGEPLLAGPDFIENVVATVRHELPRGTSASFGVQTNGTLLDTAALERLLSCRVEVGVSIAGLLAAHNVHRRFRNGDASFTRVVDGIRRLSSERYRSIFAGLICVVDISNDPVEVYEGLLEWRPPMIDVLLPHGNWSRRPPGRGDDSSTPYGDWLIAMFDRWYDAPEPETEIRFFQEVLALVLGGRSQVETVGLTPSTVLVVETDGAIEQVDALKSAFEGAASTGLHVVHDAFDQALEHPGVVARQIGRRALCAQCQACPARDVCGGGFYPHRYRPGTGFLNPSVYCADLLRFISHVGGRVRADLVRARIGVT